MISKNTYVDKLTGLPNFISFFRSDFESVYGDEGCLLYIKVNPLRVMNEKYGRDKVDELLFNVGYYLREEIAEQCYKHEGNGFLVVYKNQSDVKAKLHMAEISYIIEKAKEELNLSETFLSSFIMPYNKPIKSVADYYQLFIEVYKKERKTDNEIELFHYIVEVLSYRVNEMIDENLKVRDFAFIDEVSNLPNSKSASMYLSKMDQERVSYALLFIDGDDLKKFNNINYECGNSAIRRIATTISKSIRKNDKVFRWLSGDEFVVVAEDISYEDTIDLAERIRSNVEEDFLGDEIEATVSIGISKYPEDAETVKEIINNAEVANKEAKATGKNKFTFFNARIGS